ELGNEDQHRLTEPRPRVEVLVPRVTQWRREQDRTLDRGVGAIHESEVGPEGPADQPTTRKVVILRVLDRRGHVIALAHRRAELAAAAPRTPTRRKVVLLPLPHPPAPFIALAPRRVELAAAAPRRGGGAARVEAE